MTYKCYAGLLGTFIHRFRYRGGQHAPHKQGRGAGAQVGGCTQLHQRSVRARRQQVASSQQRVQHEVCSPICAPSHPTGPGQPTGQLGHRSSAPHRCPASQGIGVGSCCVCPSPWTLRHPCIGVRVIGEVWIRTELIRS